MALLRVNVLPLDLYAGSIFFMADVFHLLRQTQKSSALMDGGALRHLVLTQTRLNCEAGKWKIKEWREIMNY